ncbi:MAG: calcium/sodium antiporter [Bacteroidales bacterium]|nr:calcium/sodium antiporter [Bacteroidales bacterium]
MSEFVIGLTIVGFGTSCPELVVSLTGALEGNADVAVGNVLGSNIFNVLFILGLTALFRPVSMTADNRKRDIPETLLVTMLFLGFGMCHSLFGVGEADGLSRLDGAVLLALFALYVLVSFRRGKASEEGPSQSKPRNIWLSILLVLAGLAGLIFGGNLFVDSATALARMLGVSDKFIAVTILAGGTSLPELATSLVAAFKGRDQLALGNILGSNVFNILLILGASALVTPLSIASVTHVDALVLLVSVALLLLWAHIDRGERIDRWEGSLMLLLFGIYYTYLFINL